MLLQTLQLRRVGFLVDRSVNILLVRGVKFKFVKNTTALATLALFAPLANAQWDVINYGTNAGPSSPFIPNYVTSDWDTTTGDANALSSNPSALAEVSSLEGQINNFITDEGTYKAILETEVVTNNTAIGLNETALVAAQSDLAVAIAALDDANTIVFNATVSRDDAQAIVDSILANNPSIDPIDFLTYTPEYIAALNALIAAQETLDTAIIVQTAAQNLVIAAQDAVDAAEYARVAFDSRATALNNAIVRSDQRVIDAGNAWTTIQTAIALKEGNFSALYDAIDAFADGITSTDINGNVTVNDLDTIINTVDGFASDEDGIGDPVDLAALPVALDGSALDTAALDPVNDPSSFAAIITEAQDALNSITSPLTAEEKNQLLNALANGAFEREAITEIAGDIVNIVALNENVFSDGLEDGEVGIAGVITKKADSTVHIGENSLVTAEVGGVQQLYATDALSNSIDIDIANGSNLLINSDPVATQLYVDQAEADANAYSDAADADYAAVSVDSDALIQIESDVADAALQADIDQNETDSDNVDEMLQNDIYMLQANIASLQSEIIMLQSESDPSGSGNLIIGVTDASVAATAAVTALTDAVFSDDLDPGEVGIHGVITKNASGEVHIGENSLVTNEVGGVQKLYAKDAGSNAIDIDIQNGSNLLINGDPVATQLYADQAIADEAQSRADAHTALTNAFTGADTAQSAALTTAFTGADTAQSAALVAAFTDADAALQANIDALAASMQTYIDSAVAQARSDGVTAGIQAVTSNPQSYQLYNESSIMEMNVTNPTLSMLNESEEAQVEFTLETSTDLEDWDIEERIQRTVQATGDKFFVRIKSGAPYVTPDVLVFNHPSYGEILTDQSGNVLYGFSIDSVGGDPTYIGAAWPLAPQTTDPKPDAGVTAALTSGTFSNASGGPWLKINNRPVYTYASDSGPNQASGHGLGFVWYTIKPDGTLNQ